MALRFGILDGRPHQLRPRPSFDIRLLSEFSGEDLRSSFWHSPAMLHPFSLDKEWCEEVKVIEMPIDSLRKGNLMTVDFEKFFEPKSVVVVGASAGPP